MNLSWRLFWKRLMAGIRLKGESAVTMPHTPDQGRRAIEAKVALGRSRAMLERVDSNEGRVDRLHESMRRLNDENGFAALIYRSLGGRG